MPHIVFTVNAVKSLEGLRAFLLTCDEEVATKALATIKFAILSLKGFPFKGRPAPFLGREVRELLVPFGNSGYLVAYRVLGHKIVILTVRHQKEQTYHFS